MILLGLWVGKGHPQLYNYLHPLMKDLQTAETIGYHIRNEHGRVIRVRAVVFDFTADLKAKVLL